ncbi:hypothetical protein BFP72_14840 [Reichenbachiella sp. 5M10]|nr:hypothetical protein BFP72_14840 [Reichenbachiella sp. 5M10]
MNNRLHPIEYLGLYVRWIFNQLFPQEPYTQQDSFPSFRTKHYREKQNFALGLTTLYILVCIAIVIAAAFQ